MQLNRHNTRELRLIQARFRGARKVQLDSADRLNLPKHLTERYGIANQVVISCFLDQIEVWAQDKFEEDIAAMTPELIDQLENEILGGSGPIVPPTIIDPTKNEGQ